MNRQAIVKLINDWRDDGSQILEAKHGHVWITSVFKDPINIGEKQMRETEYRIVEKPKPIEIEEGTRVYGITKGFVGDSCGEYQGKDLIDGYKCENIRIAYDQPQNISMKPWSGGDMPEGVEGREVFLVFGDDSHCSTTRPIGTQWNDVKWYGIIPKFMLEDKA
jgi:hypothetical protein